ncbi:MAG: hypothetical protein FWG69_06175 [Oscillospiraceae bacterium]|nr:hypothetical protein [Oscillospiraceae bacterium]
MKTKLKMRKMLSLFITLIMLGTMLPANFAFAEMPNDPNEPNDPDEMKSYIVVTDSDGTFSDVVDIIDDDAITENELLAENLPLIRREVVFEEVY